jgi:aminoglycoside phosphotransferase (APT) family kinase protein
VEALPHGYTNHIVRSGSVVTKSYQGPDAVNRSAREAEVLAALAGRLPVPPFIGRSGAEVRMSFMAGVHGQDLIGAGLAPEVLRACGEMLRDVQAVDPQLVVASAGAILVHGDYGPNNVLLDPEAQRVVAIVDWEWAHAGDPVEDLAWCEWIIRMHHPDQAGVIGTLFDGYGHCPPWAARHHAMVGKCEFHLRLSEQREPGGRSARRRRDFLDATKKWSGFMSATERWSE